MKLAGHSDGRSKSADGKTYVLGKRVTALRFTPDGTRLVSGGEDFTVRVWELATGKLLADMTAPQTHEIKCLAVSPDGKYALSGHGSYGGVKLWDLEAGTLAHDLLKAMYIDGVGFSKDSGEAVASKGGTRFWVWTVATGAAKKEAKDEQGKSAPSAISPDGKLNIVQTKTGLKLTTLPGGKKLRELAHPAAIHSIAFDPDGTRIAAGDAKGGWAVWNVANGTVVASAQGSGKFDDRCESIGFVGDRLAIGRGRNGVTFVGLDGATVSTHAVHGMSIEAHAVSPDGKRIAVGDHDGFIHLVDAPG
jgi:WD40 repeat protein